MLRATIAAPSASGRKRHNVLGAYDPITHEAITVTNDTYINQDVFCEFLEKIANGYADSGRPITLVLDNARYQKCQSVANKAKELNIELLYLPPYSPNLNLIERLNGWTKPLSRRKDPPPINLLKYVTTQPERMSTQSTQMTRIKRVYTDLIF